MTLLDQVEQAVRSGGLKEPFRTCDVKNWVKMNKILKEDGTQYKASYLNSFCSSSVINSTSTKTDKRLVKVSQSSRRIARYKFK